MFFGHENGNPWLVSNVSIFARHLRFCGEFFCTDKDGNVTFEYSIDKNSDLAANLKGHLLLVTGDFDNNVHPSNTMRMAQALIKANKRFDMFVFPGARHGYGDYSAYWFWVKSDYFCEHLIGERPRDVDMVELRRETEQNGKRQQDRGTTDAPPPPRH